MKNIMVLFLLFLMVDRCFAQNNWTHGPLKVSADGRYLQFTDGKPFFWLGDTGWEIFQRLNKPEVETYLENRRRKGFNVIQACALGLFDGLRLPDQYGDLPFDNMDPTKPNEKYFRWVDTVISMAKNKNIFIGLLPVWGDYVVETPNEGPVVFNEANAYTYGKWIASRYASYPNIIWILGGDKSAIRNGNDTRAVWRAMAKGIKEVTGNKALIGYHPQGNASSSTYLHQEAWLDFNMFQSGHGDGHDAAVWDYVSKDRALTPAKPTIDGEPNYEDHPVNPWPKWDPASGYFRSYDVRKQVYRSVFAGACGVTYGHHAVWQFSGRKFKGVNFADRGWIEAIDRPGAVQTGYLRRLIESRAVLNRIPDQDVIVEGQGDKTEHSVAFRAADSSYGMVYLPLGKKMVINGSFINSKNVVAWWFNPSTATATKIGLLKNSNQLIFTPPVTGPEHDWVLVLDNPGKHFAAPGKSK